MHPFARQLLSWQADNPERRAAALGLEVTDDSCHDIRRMLTELDRGEDYIELSLDGRLTWKPAALVQTAPSRRPMLALVCVRCSDVRPFPGPMETGRKGT